MMKAVEIEEAVSALAERSFDSAEFPFLFLEAFGNNEATIKKLRAALSGGTARPALRDFHSDNWGP